MHRVILTHDKITHSFRSNNWSLVILFFIVKNEVFREKCTKNKKAIPVEDACVICNRFVKLKV